MRNLSLIASLGLAIVFCLIGCGSSENAVNNNAPAAPVSQEATPDATASGPVSPNGGPAGPVVPVEGGGADGMLPEDRLNNK
jgi:hypothetical protein